MNYNKNSPIIGLFFCIKKAAMAANFMKYITN